MGGNRAFPTAKSDYVFDLPMFVHMKGGAFGLVLKQTRFRDYSSLGLASVNRCRTD
jgi:hypothetical protein